MQADVKVRELSADVWEEARKSYSEDEVRSAQLEAIEGHVMRVSMEELSRHGLRMTDEIKGGGNVQRTGCEFMRNHLGESYGTFRVAFKGERVNAISATKAWALRLQDLGAVEEMTHLSIRGTDGTNLHEYSEEIMEAAENLPPDLAARIEAELDGPPHPTEADDIDALASAVYATLVKNAPSGLDVERHAFPPEAARLLVKTEFLDTLGLLEDAAQYVPDAILLRPTSETLPEREAAYDRFIAERGLTDKADAVLKRILFQPGNEDAAPGGERGSD